MGRKRRPESSRPPGAASDRALSNEGLSQDIAGDVRLRLRRARGVVCSIDAPLHEVAGSD